jgi:hypothetical protein
VVLSKGRFNLGHCDVFRRFPSAWDHVAMGNWSGGADFAAVGTGLDLRVLAAVPQLPKARVDGKKKQGVARRAGDLEVGRSVLRPYVVC